MLTRTEPIHRHADAATEGSDAAVLALTGRLTAIILLLRPLGVWWIAPFALAGAALSLIVPSISRRPVTWWILSALVALDIVVRWPLADNHIYLLAYWCLALGLAAASPTPASALSSSGRWLLGCAFALAVLWKAVLSPDYLDGRFFRVTLLTDDRFADAVILVGGLSASQVRENRALLTPLPEGAVLADPGRVHEPRAFRILAASLTWGGVLLEAALALSFLSPIRLVPAMARHVALQVFCVTTYAFAPVAGFGWLIATMGLAQCRPDQRTLRSLYIAIFVLVLLYAEIPWAGVVANWIGPATP